MGATNSLYRKYLARDSLNAGLATISDRCVGRLFDILAWPAAHSVIRIAPRTVRSSGWACWTVDMPIPLSPAFVDESHLPLGGVC